MWSEEKQKSFVLGAVVGGILMGLILLLGVRVMIMPGARKNALDLIACQEKFSEDTILYDPGAGSQKPPGISVLGGLAEISPGPAITQGRAEQGQRWFIPAKVQPIIYGDPTGVRYFYYNPATHKMDGPYIPEVSR